MGDPITDRVEQLLTVSDHILVPVDMLYEQLAGEGLMAWIEPDIFEYLLFSDDRFEIVESFGDTALLGLGEDVALIDDYNFLGGPRVMLRSRADPPQALMLDVLFHLQEMNRALETAWHQRPVDNPEIEAELINMLMLGDMLERELRDALDVDAPTQEGMPSREI